MEAEKAERAEADDDADEDDEAEEEEAAAAETFETAEAEGEDDDEDDEEEEEEDAEEDADADADADAEEEEDIPAERTKLITFKMARWYRTLESARPSTRNVIPDAPCAPSLPSSRTVGRTPGACRLKWDKANIAVVRSSRISPAADPPPPPPPPTPPPPPLPPPPPHGVGWGRGGLDLRIWLRTGY